MINTDEIKTGTLAAVVVQRIARALGRFLKTYGWILYLNVILVVMGHSIGTWEYWAATIPTIILQAVSIFGSNAESCDPQGSQR